MRRAARSPLGAPLAAGVAVRCRFRTTARATAGRQSKAWDTAAGGVGLAPQHAVRAFKELRGCTLSTEAVEPYRSESEGVLSLPRSSPRSQRAAVRCSRLTLR